jgi:hypothetical protein
MKQIERASIMRIVSDMVIADAIIDVREIEFIENIKNKYSIKKEDEILGASYTLSYALSVLIDSTDSLKQELVEGLINVSLSDNYCSREEAILLIAIKICLSSTELSAKIISMNTSNIFIEPTQILYVESEFDNDINWEINEAYRELKTEMRLAGFDFVYIPKIANHYRSITASELLRIIEFLYPKASLERLQTVTKQLQNLSTSEFCKDQLSGKLGVKEFSNVAPSLMIKIGDSFVNDKRIANFLILEIDKNVLNTVRNSVDYFSHYYQTSNISRLKQEKGRFIYTGFYKQIFDLYMLQKGVKRSVVIDIYRNVIRFPEADVQMEKLHRREKALYALFLLESASGGINFVKPETPRQFAKYKKRMSAIQTKYRLIYQKFGGEAENAPDISIPEIRLPMIALIKKQLKAHEEVLFHVDDYMIQRNMFGNYCVNIHPSLCCCCGLDNKDVTALSDSIEWQKISAL